MKKFKSINIILLVITLVLQFSCSDDVNDDSDHGHAHENETKLDDHGHAHPEKEAEHHESEEIHLTSRQVNTIGLELGGFSEVKISDFVKATGTLGLPPDAYSSVSAKAEGFIKRVNKYVEGSMVKRGAVIAYLENPELIEKQELYLSVNAELVYLEQEYARQKLLFDQNAGVEREVQRLKSEVEIKRAKKLGAENYLKYLGVNTNKVLSGNFIQSIPIVAPLTGFITSIDMHNGMYVKPEQQLLEIVSEDHLHLELDVFERDIASVVEDQKITYMVPALGNKIYEGEVHVIGKEFDNTNKTVRIHGHPEGDKPKFIKDLFISAKIWLNDQKRQALPSEAVMKDGEFSYIYYSHDNIGIKDMYFFKLKVLAGESENDFVSVTLLEELPKGAKIVTKGTYFIYAQSKYGEAEHDH